MGRDSALDVVGGMSRGIEPRTAGTGFDVRAPTDGPPPPLSAAASRKDVRRVCGRTERRLASDGESAESGILQESRRTRGVL
jgi:hypothetical protein